MYVNNIIQKLVDNEKNFNNGINMVPSENYVSVFSRLPMLFDIYNRYNFNPQLAADSWYFRGTETVADVEKDIIQPILKEKLLCEYVNVNFISGLNCMTVIMKALGGNAGNEILMVSRDSGGHYATEALAKSFGFTVSFLELNDKFDIEFSEILKKVNEKTSLVYIDQSYALFPIDTRKLSEMIKSVSEDIIIHVDVSHWLGLILGNALTNPLQHVDSIGGSTHKTFPGPQKAIFACNDSSLYDKVKEAQYYLLSSNHFGSTISLALSLLEFFETGGEKYAQQIVVNAKTFAKKLYELGCDVKYPELGFTNCHQVWVDTQSLGIDSYNASNLLKKCLINTNVLVDLPKFPHPTFRFGVNEVTRLGFKEKQMDKLAELIVECIKKQKDPCEIKSELKRIKDEVKPMLGYDMKDKRISHLFDMAIDTLRGDF